LMSLSGKMNFLAEAACPAHRKAGQSGRIPDPVTGSASRQGRLTASPGGALSGRDRPLQCEKVSKAFHVQLAHAGGGGGGGGR
jgi:hypothetical protein